MKTNFLKTGVVLLLLGVVFVGCERNGDNSSYNPCHCEKESFRGPKFPGGKAYLFRDTISEEMLNYLSNKIYSDPFPIMSWIVFCSKKNEAILNIGNLHFPEGGHILSVGQICNFSYFAKEWTIPENGINVSFEGVMREPCNPYGWTNVVRFDFILTNLTRM